MNDERLEQELRRLPAPELPAAWRDEILAAARQALPSAQAGRAAWSFCLPDWRAIFARNPISAGALAALWLLIFVFKAATPADPMEREMLAHVDPHRSIEIIPIDEQIRLVEAWSSEPEPRPRL